jgi:opacity protein-like surface antigen
VFIGADVTRAKVDFDYGFHGTAIVDGATVTNGSVSQDDTDTSYGLKAGMILDKNHRLYAYYTKLKPESEDLNTKLKIITLNYEYLIDTGYEGLKPYIGAHVGQSDFEALGYDDQGLMYGAQAGILFDITDNIELELGIAYSMMDAEPRTPALTQVEGNVALINASLYAELEKMTRAYFGVNLKF